MADGFDPYKTLQVDPEADDEVIKAAYRRTRAQVPPGRGGQRRRGREDGGHQRRLGSDRRPGSAPPLRPGPKGTRLRDRGDAARGRVGWRGARGNGVGRGRTGPGRVRFGGLRADGLGPHRGPRRAAGPAGATGHATPLDAPAPTRAGLARLDVRSLVARRRLRPRRCARADGLGAAGPPPGRPSGSVLNFGRYSGWSLGEIARHGHRIHRVARPHADRPPVPRRDRPAPSEGRASTLRGRRAAATAEGCSAAATALRRCAPNESADRRALDEQGEQHDPERDLLEQRPLGQVRRQGQGHRDGDGAAQAAPEQDVQPAGGHARRRPGSGRQPGDAAEQHVDDERPADQDADDRPGDRPERVDQTRRRDRQTDQQERRPPSGGRRGTPRRCRSRRRRSRVSARPGPEVPEHDRGVTVAMTPERWNPSAIR